LTVKDSIIFADIFLIKVEDLERKNEGKERIN
jgi:hypothetical protein